MRRDHLTMHVELADGDGQLLWIADYDRAIADLEPLQESIATGVDRLRLPVATADRRRLARRDMVNAEAYRLYTKGRYFWKRRTLRDLETSIKYFEQAIAIDPKYALAHAGLADAYNALGGSGGTPKRPRREYFGAAKRAALDALALDADLVEAHGSLATALDTLDWKWSGAEAEYKRALALNPRYAPAYGRYGMFLAFRRRFDEAVAVMKQAEDLDPVSVSIAADFGLVYNFARRPDEAIVQIRKALELVPEYGRSRFDLIDAYLQKGMMAAAAAELDALTDNGNVGVRRAVDRVNAVLQRPTHTREILRTLHEQHARGDLIDGALDIAELHARLGEDDEAFRWLEIAYQERLPAMRRLFVDPRWGGVSHLLGSAMGCLGESLCPSVLNPMNAEHVTELLVACSAGDEQSLERLTPLVYDELRRLASRHLAHERGESLQPTALAHEAYLRLIDQRSVNWQNRVHFFAIAARLMRRILIDHARRRVAQRRGGGAVHVPLDGAGQVSLERSGELLALNEALDELATVDARKSQVVELRFFGGLSVRETAEMLGVSEVTVMRDWSTARAWLHRSITGSARAGDA